MTRRGDSFRLAPCPDRLGPGSVVGDELEERRQSLDVLDVGDRNGDEEIAIACHLHQRAADPAKSVNRPCHDFWSSAGACTPAVIVLREYTRALQSQLVADNA